MAKEQVKKESKRKLPLQTIEVADKVYKRRKATKDFISIGEGQTFVGYIGDLKTLTTKNHPNGLPYFEATEAETGMMINLWANGGLRGKLSMAQVDSSTLIEIVGKGLIPFEVEGEVRQVNDYEVFILEN